MHELKHVDVENDNCGFDILMRLEPFLGIAHRSIDVFRVLNGSMMTLYSLEERPPSLSQVPVNYSFFYSEYSRFSGRGQHNDEVMEIFRELCHELESMGAKEELQMVGPRKPSSTHRRTR